MEIAEHAGVSLPAHAASRYKLLARAEAPQFRLCTAVPDMPVSGHGSGHPQLLAGADARTSQRVGHHDLLDDGPRIR